ncbi:MAG TPA: SDR family oxidoreductase [Capsulimonadaceae bacterium]|jgi:NAD(P)-dependent dehydrogenase (short-subunit alcohol dehydrogenase family)
MDTSSLSGKTIIVTGAGGGIGEAIALLVHEQGGNIVIGDIRSDAGAAVASRLGSRAIAIACDVRSDADQQRLVDVAIERFGRVDGLVNNAGVNFVKPFLDTTDDDWERVIGTDLKASFFLTQKVVRVLLRQTPIVGSIINIASVHALAGLPCAGPYDAAKAGVVGLTRCLAVELGEFGIRVNAVSPGLVDTQIFRDIVAASPDPDSIINHWMGNIPLRRKIDPREIAEVVCFLLSDRSGAITGANHVADAGMTSQLVNREPASK